MPSKILSEVGNQPWPVFPGKILGVCGPEAYSGWPRCTLRLLWCVATVSALVPNLYLVNTTYPILVTHLDAASPNSPIALVFFNCRALWGPSRYLRSRDALNLLLRCPRSCTGDSKPWFTKWLAHSTPGSTQSVTNCR